MITAGICCSVALWLWTLVVNYVGKNTHCILHFTPPSTSPHPCSEFMEAEWGGFLLLSKGTCCHFCQYVPMKTCQGTAANIIIQSNERMQSPTICKNKDNVIVLVFTDCRNKQRTSIFLIWLLYHLTWYLISIYAFTLNILRGKSDCEMSDVIQISRCLGRWFSSL